MAITIEHRELDGFPQEQRTLEGLRATRKLVCAWSDRYLLRGALVGEGSVARPQTYPYNINWGAVVRGVTVEPFGGQKRGAVTEGSTPSSYLASYDEALLTVEYGTPTGRDEPKIDESSPGPESYFVETLDLGIEHIQLDHSKFKWSGSDNPLEAGEAPSKVIATGSYSITHYYTPYAPDAIDSLAGKVNSGTYTAKGIYKSSGVLKSWAAGKLLMMPIKVETVTSPEGNERLNISYTMAIRDNGWNKFWDANAGIWDSIAKIDGGAAVNVYESDSFSGMTV